MLTHASRVAKAASRTHLRLASDEQLVEAVRSGRAGAAAFEALYERHSGRLFAFSIYMLGSRDDAEDALQATFASAHRALLADRRTILLRPWLFTIARNECVDILRRRRPTAELNGEPATTGDPVKALELREQLRDIVEDVSQLPERQRASLVLAEVSGLSQEEIARVLDVRADQVKAYMYQARTKLISQRKAREADCIEIRQELATARGAVLLRGRLRRHLRSCSGCRAYADGVKRQRHQLTAFLPIGPALGLKYRVLEEVLGSGVAEPATYIGGAAVGTSLTATIAELAGGGAKAAAVKVLAGVLALGATAEVGVTVLTARSPAPPASHVAPASTPLGGAASGSSDGPRGAVLAAAVTSTQAGAHSRAHTIHMRKAGGGASSPLSSSGSRETGGPSSDVGASNGLGKHRTYAPAQTGAGLDPSAAGQPDDSSVPAADGTKSSGPRELSPQRAEHEQKRAQRKLEREERQAQHQARPQSPHKVQTPTEEIPEVGFSEAPKKTPQERRERREEREKRHQEHEEQPEGEAGSEGGQEQPATE